ncbi:MAG: UDP-2,4-diacetamido-2,4,6-trideoxy-beta-L-altropyranose hydrolase [Lachnospiraceae bacterium]|nr:UDP-2,4-diacetamido-2,4,6-trideoxy-beta-L-altropyranose hydrolase [Lachnospiraceae bacterium]
MRNIAFLTDGNESIATGHIQRCLSIARAVMGPTHKIISQNRVFFIVSDEKSAKMLNSRFERNDEFPIYILGTDHNTLADQAPAVIDYFSQENADCLFIDSYFVNEEFLKTLHEFTHKNGKKLAYIDDIQALDSYDVDVIINNSTAIIPPSYMSVPVKLCGKPYTPLRAQFAGCDHKTRSDVSDLFIATGGTDPYGISLNLAEKFISSSSLNLHILTGEFNPDLEKLNTLSKENKRLNVYHGISDVAGLMDKCDIAISAGGTTLGELCAMGIPSISFIMASNQHDGVIEFEKDGIIPCAGDCTKDTCMVLDKLFDMASDLASKDKEKRLKISRKMREYVDGNGVMRIADALLE